MTDNTTPVKEIKIPVADPNDPYAIPAAMPSSVDHAVRSFNAGDYPEPSRKQDEWRYTPIERINEFFTVFKPSGETQIEVSMIDGSPLAEGVKLSQIKLGEGLSGTVSKPNDRVSAVEWESGRTATILELSGEIAQPVLVKVHGAGEDLDAFHLVIAAADKAHADVVVEHDGDARLAEGVEITTGAQREHRYDVLKAQAQEKGLDEDVKFYLEFFKYGCPPHGGFGLGIDRLTMLLLGLTIKEAMFIFRGPNRLTP